MPRHPRHWSLRYGLPIGGLLLFVAVYLALMRLSLGVSRVDQSHTVERRDQVYIAIHLGLLGIAACMGFALGKWLNGLGVAVAAFFLVVLSVGMLGAQVGSYALACNGGSNDIIRHWEC